METDIIVEGFNEAERVNGLRDTYFAGMGTARYIALSYKVSQFGDRPSSGMC